MSTGMETLTRAQLEDIALWLRAYDAALFAQAVSYAHSRAPIPKPPGHCSACWGQGNRCQHCTLPGGHDGNHIDGIGHAWQGAPGHAELTPAGATP